MVETVTAGKWKSSNVKRKSPPQLLMLTLAQKRNQAKDEKRLDGLCRKINASILGMYVRARTI